MIIKTRVFKLAQGKYHNLSDLAKAMGLSVSQVYRVRVGKRGINEKFLIGAKKAFPEYRIDELFYFHTGQTSGDFAEITATRQYDHAIR
jgi:16S rRNA U516 pseudouridylate synthase RsuA-like enzyme